MRKAIEAKTPLVMVNVMPQQANAPRFPCTVFAVFAASEECNYVQLDARIKADFEPIFSLCPPRVTCTVCFCFSARSRIDVHLHDARIALFSKREFWASCL